MSNSEKEKISQQKKPTKSSYAVLFLALGAMAFFGVCNPQSMQSNLSGMAGSVGGLDITNMEFSRAYSYQTEQLRQQYGEQFDASLLKVAAQTMDALVKERVLYLAADQLGLAATDKEVVKRLANSNLDYFKDENGKFSRERFRQVLYQNNLSENSYMESERRSISEQKLRQLIMRSVFASTKTAKLDWEINQTKLTIDYLKFDPTKIELSISPEDIEKFLAAEDSEEKLKNWYESHKSDYQSEPKVRASHILVAYKGAARNDTAERSKEDALKLANEILAKVTSPGADFTQLAKSFSDEPQAKQKGGDLGFFTKETMTKTFSDAAFALQPGQISSIVESEFGFHIIKVTDKQAEKNVTLQEAKQEIASTLIRKAKTPQLAESKAQELLEKILKNEDVNKELAELKINWEKTKEFQLTSKYVPGIGSDDAIMEAILAIDEQKSPIYGKILRVGQNIFVIKLGPVKKPKPEDLKEEQLKQMAFTSAYSQGYTNFNDFQNQAVEEYEKKKAIYRNPAYLALDERSNDSHAN